MAKMPPDYHIQHEKPPIFFCWKYWLTTGELKEGCTPIKAGPNDDFLDLNEYGWVYITIPVIAAFLLFFLLYCACRGKHTPAKHQPLMSEESESEDDPNDFRSRGKSYAVPVRADPRNGRSMYTVVPMEYGNQKKMPLHGGIETAHMYNQQQQRIYPRLTTMRKQAGMNGQSRDAKVTSPKSLEATGRAENAYQPEPTSLSSVKGATAPPANKVEHDDEDTTTDESEDEQ